MERLKELIDQLKDQFDRKVEAGLMLETTRLLEAELRQLPAQPQPAKVVPTKIAVMMPSAVKYSAQPTAPTPPEPKKEIVNQRNAAAAADTVNTSNIHGSTNSTSNISGSTNNTSNINGSTSNTSNINGSTSNTNNINTTTVNSNTINGTPLTTAQPPATGTAPITTPVPVTATITAPATATLQAMQERGQWPFDPLAEKPTDRFTLSQKAREVNDVIGANGTSSLNDKLKSDVSDLKSALNDTPVRDLRKAIGVNDRYVFINQLFRGDEVMYERSLKTINGFRILPEAEYWMERELKVKLGWDENRETTRHFYQLVKRRFS